MRPVEQPIRTIVVGFDGTEPARRALARATDLAEALGAKLVVVAVADAPLPSVGFDAALPGENPAQLAQEATLEIELAEQTLTAARELVGERAGGADFVSELGHPADRIVAVAEERAADLVVVGTREPGFLERLFEGSVSTDVSRHTRRDVLIVH
jgi:nucleotide-binding universal stress UspA family protein